MAEAMSGLQKNRRAQRVFPRQQVTGMKTSPTSKQFCSGEDYGAYPLRDPDSAECDNHSSRRCLFQLNQPAWPTCITSATRNSSLEA
jgi:hypothetical protein